MRLQPNPAFQNPSPSSKASAQAAQDDPASSSPAQDDSCLQQPRLDGARSDQLFFFRGHSSAPQGISGRQAPSPPMLLFGPKTIKKTKWKLRAWQADPKVENEWPEPQSAPACAVQVHLVTFRKNSKSHRKCVHFGSPFPSFWVPFSRLSPTSGPRAPGPRPKVGTR